MLLALTINFILIIRAYRRGFSVPSFRFKSVLMLILWGMFISFAGVTVGVEISNGKRIIEWWATLFIGIYLLSSYWDWRQVRLVSANANND